MVKITYLYMATSILDVKMGGVIMIEAWTIVNPIMN
jgi:hypothetical protein